MKILQVIDSLAIGGAEKLIVETVPLLVEKGNEVDVLLLNGFESGFYKDLEVLDVCNIFSLGFKIYDLRHILKIIPYLKKYDIVHVHLFPAQYFVVLAKIISFSNVKLVFTEHSTGNKRLNSSKYKYLERFIYKFYNKIVCITTEVKNVLVNKLNIEGSKLVILENGVNFRKIDSAVKYQRNSFGFSESDKLLIMVAGFRREKDHETVVKTLGSLSENYKLLFVGDGVNLINIKKLVNDLNLDNRVSFLGIRTDVYSILKMSDFAIVSSHWEGFGLVAVEAMACKLPVIASNVNGLAQVVDGGGILFQKSNVEDLSQKIIELDDEKYYEMIRQQCYEKSKNYSLTIMVDKLNHLYKSL